MIIGVTGPIASGKNVFTDVLLEHGFILKNISDEVRIEAKARGLPIERKTLQNIGNEMRERFGNEYWARRVLASLDLTKNYVITGVRNPGEIEEFRKHRGFILVGVNAPIEKRFLWIMARDKDSDPKDLDGVKAIDARDRGQGEAASGQQVDVCHAMADYYLMNDGTIEEFKGKAKQLISDLKI